MNNKTIGDKPFKIVMKTVLGDIELTWPRNDSVEFRVLGESDEGEPNQYVEWSKENGWVNILKGKGDEK